jgi:hypothetical protein
METRKRVLGQEHPDTLNIMNNLAFTYKLLCRTDEAIIMMEQVIALRSRIIGDSHPDTKGSEEALVMWNYEVALVKLKGAEIVDDDDDVHGDGDDDGSDF